MNRQEIEFIECIDKLKYRVWNGEQMISPDYIDRDGNAHWTENSIPQISKNVMQYIGLKDKNKQDIYENDIIEYTWQCGGKKEKLISKVPSVFCHHWFDELLVWGSNIKIIGNIYENSNLLDNKNTM